MRVLIADDDPIQRRMLQAILVKWHYDVTTAPDGEEAWRILSEADGPLLAILDWMMPGLSGPEVCRRIRSRQDGFYIYVVLLTGRDSKEDLLEGMDAGADDYLRKPCDPSELQVRLRAGSRILDLESRLWNSLRDIQKKDALLERARQAEVEIGAKIQSTLLLGQPPRFTLGMDIAAFTVPSQSVDGDFYDFLRHSETCLDVIVGDVMGKGIPAALLGAALKSSILRALGFLIESCERGVLPEPEAIVTRVHRDVTTQFIGLEQFASLIYARFDLSAREVHYVDCGHTKTIRLSKDGMQTLLEGESMPLGFSAKEVYRQNTVPIDPGDLFFFYSDGVTESVNAKHELFGRARLVDLLRSRRELPANGVIQEVVDGVVAYSGSRSFADDLTCVAIKIAAEMEDLPIASVERRFSSAMSELPSILHVVQEFCRNNPQPLDEPRAYHLQLAVVEAASNIIRHAYDSRPDGWIHLQASAWDDRVVLHLHHGGVAFEPETVEEPAFDGSRDGGFGVYIMSQCADEVRYSRHEGGWNTVELVKKRLSPDRRQRRKEQANGYCG